jgi:hypothetical protein
MASRWPALILIVASALPVLLTGRAVYHCRVTGVESLSCSCAAPAESAASPDCCDDCAPADAGPSPVALAALGSETTGSCSLGDSSDLCRCCDVTTLRWVGITRSPGPDSDERIDLDARLAGVPAPLPVISRKIASVAPTRAGPPIDSPLFRLHCAFLL